MSPFLLFLVLSCFTSIGQFLSLVRSITNKQKTTGQLPLTAMSFWAIGYAFIFFQDLPPLGLGLLLNAVLISGFHLFCYKATSRHINLPRWQVGGAVLTCLSLFIIPLLPIEPVLKISLYSFSGIINTLLILLLCERIFHILKANNDNGGQMLISLGIISGTLFVVFCDMMVSPVLSVTRVQLMAIALSVSYPLFYVGVRKLDRVPRKLMISRPLAFHTTLFSIAGTYLIGMSGVGLLIQKFGFSYTSTITLLGAALFPLTYLLSSGNARRKILVWISKHLFSAQFDYREIWKNINTALAPELQGELAAQAALTASLQAINYKGGSYYQLRYGRWRCVATASGDLSHDSVLEIERLSKEICDSAWIVDIEEANRDPRNYPMLSEKPSNLLKDKVHWFVPVKSGGSIVGIWIIAFGEKPQWPLNWETRDLLGILSQKIESYIRAQETLKKLSEHAQLAAFHQTSAFVIHDMKNVFAQLSMINQNAVEHIENPLFVDDMLKTMSSVEARMAKMLAKLTNKQQNKSQSTPIEFELVFWLKRQESEILNQCKNSNISFLFPENNEFMVLADKERFSNVFKHLIDNALHASKGADSPFVKIICEFSVNHAKIAIMDNGEGMTEEFIKSKLFKPFETTKGNAGMGLGAYDAKRFSEDSSGELVVESKIGEGTTFTLILPRSGIL